MPPAANRCILSESEQGQSFAAFLRFLLSDRSQLEFKRLLEQIEQLPQLAGELRANPVLRQLLKRLQDESRKVVRTNHRLTEHLRRALDGHGLQERRQVAAHIQEIKSLAQSLRGKLDPATPLIELSLKPYLNAPMERPLWRQREEIQLRGQIEDHMEKPLSELQLTDLLAVDMARLRNNVDLALRDREQVTLTDLLASHPPEQGVFDLIGYLAIATKSQLHQVDAYFNATDIKARAGYDRVGSSLALNTPARVPADSLLHKLEFQREHPLAWWVERRIAERFNYLCTDDLDRFDRADLAITSGGLIKSGRTHRIKDDRHLLGDRSQYVLGWTNEGKIEAYRSEYKRLAQELRSLDDTIGGMQKRLGILDTQLKAFGMLSNVTSFAQVDPLSLLRRVEEMEREKAVLASADDSLSALNAQIAEVLKRIARLGKERDGAITDHDRLGREIKSHQDRIKRYEFINDQWKDASLEEVAAKAGAHSEEPLSLENLTDIRDALRTVLASEIKTLAARETKLREEIVRAMVLFRQEFGGERGENNVRVQDYSDEISALDDFCGLASDLEFHGLPMHEQKFREMLKNNVVRDIALFQRGLETHVGDSLANLLSTDNP